MTGNRHTGRRLAAHCAALLAVLWLMPVAADAGDPFAQAPTAPVHSQALFGKTLFTLSDGDFVHPRLSPDGQRVVYADAFVREGAEGTAIYITDIKTRATRTLLNPAEAKKHQVYGVFVTSIEWLNNARVKIDLSDGDVGSTSLTLDVTTGAILSQKEHDPGEELWKYPPRLAELRRKIRSTFPKWTTEVLDDTLRHNPIEVPGRGVILQRNYAGFDHNIWFIDLSRKEQTTLLVMGEEDTLALGGGFSVGGDTVFAVTHGKYVYLFRLNRKGELTALARYRKTQWRPSLSVRATSEHEAMFLLELGESYERGHNPALRYSTREGLTELSDCRNCADFDISRDGDLAVVASWVGERRQLKLLTKGK